MPKGALLIEIFRADNTASSKKLNKDWVTLSGTKVREMLSKGIAPPPEFSRPEVAKILMEYYQSTLAQLQADGSSRGRGIRPAVPFLFQAQPWRPWLQESLVTVRRSGVLPDRPRHSARQGHYCD